MKNSTQSCSSCSHHRRHRSSSVFLTMGYAYGKTAYKVTVVVMVAAATAVVVNLYSVT